MKSYGDFPSSGAFFGCGQAVRQWTLDPRSLVRIQAPEPLSVRCWTCCLFISSPKKTGALPIFLIEISGQQPLPE